MASVCQSGIYTQSTWAWVVWSVVRTHTYCQWCSWSCPGWIRYRYSPRSCPPWASRRWSPRCSTAGWSYRSTSPLQQRERERETCVLHVWTREVKTNRWCNRDPLTLRFAFTLDASDSMAGTDQSAAQVRPLPLVVNVVEVAVLYTTIWQGRETCSWWDSGMWTSPRFALTTQNTQCRENVREEKTHTSPGTHPQTPVPAHHGLVQLWKDKRNHWKTPEPKLKLLWWVSGAWKTKRQMHTKINTNPKAGTHTLLSGQDFTDVCESDCGCVKVNFKGPRG